MHRSLKPSLSEAAVERHGDADHKGVYEQTVASGVAKEPGLVHSNSADETAPDANDQEGVRKADAITLVWSRKSLILAYLL